MQIAQCKLNMISRDDTTIMYGVSAFTLSLKKISFKFYEFQKTYLYYLEVNLLSQSNISGFSYMTTFPDECRNITSFKTDAFSPLFSNSLLVYWFSTIKVPNNIMIWECLESNPSKDKGRIGSWDTQFIYRLFITSDK